MPLSSQYQWNPVLINPSFAGSAEGSEFTVSYRNQWLKMKGSPITQYFSWNTLLKNNKLAIGAQVYRDVFGVTRKNGVYGVVGYNLKLTESTRLSFGLSGGLDFIGNNWGEVSTIEENDPSFESNSPLFVAPNFTPGLRLFGKNYFISFSLPNMLTHEQVGNSMKVSNRTSQYNYFLGGAYSFDLSQDWKIRTGLLLKYLKNAPFQAVFSATSVFKEMLEVGLAYRTNDAMILLIRVSPVKQLSIGYSFDITLSELATYTSGSHEISLSYRLKYSGNLVSPRYF
jgi:type IX secretion system PorP/SprF family membrane protein